MDLECDLPEDEEEILVYVEFEGFVDSKTFSNEKLQLDMIGLDLDFPIMQVNGKFYEGTYEDAVGTYMFFEKDDNPVVDDPMFDTIPTLKYLTKTRKLLKMQRIFTMPRAEVLGDSNHSNCVPNMNTIRQAGVPPKYQEKALQFWTKMRDDRMEALNTYLEKQKIREEKKLQGIKPDSESDEDNPFAMYKHMEFEGASAKDMSDDVSVDVEGHEKVSEACDMEDILDSMQLEELSEENEDDTYKLRTNGQRKSTVKDAGLITVESNTDDVASSVVRRKHRATVKVIRKGKGSVKSSKRVIRKKQVFASEEKSNDDVTEDKQQGCQTKTDRNIAVQEMETDTEVAETSKVVLDSRENVESETVSVLKEFETVTNIVSSTNKRLEKQAKREAKMKEISEKVKKLGEKALEDKTHDTNVT